LQSAPYGPPENLIPLVKHLRSQVLAYLQEPVFSRDEESVQNNQDMMHKAVDYFEKISQLMSSDTEAKALTRNHIFRIEKLVKIFEEYKAHSERAFEKIRLYLTTVNTFFKDSSKAVFFHPEIGELFFYITQGEDSKVGHLKDVDLLSSGEKQILILLTYVCFGTEAMFLIDEPELSLHPKWQEAFLDALKQLLGSSKTQLVIATHSPSIVGTNRHDVKVLLPYNIPR
jgi:predicted ATPase